MILLIFSIAVFIFSVAVLINAIRGAQLANRDRKNYWDNFKIKYPEVWEQIQKNKKP